jgi:methyl-accepting chemotaxis protein/methyl-accepting chemotaxis protein-1 (serine sensor receptor)
MGGLTLLLGIVAVWGLHSMEKNLQMVTSDALAGVAACSKVESGVLEMRGEMLKHIGSSDDADMNEIEAHIKQIKIDVDHELEGVRAAIYSDEERQLNAKIAPLMEGYYAHWEKDVFPLSAAGKNNEAYAEYRKGGKTVAELLAAVKAETEYNRKLGERYTAEASATSSLVNWTTWIVILVSVVVGGGLMYYTSTNISTSLRAATDELLKGADQVASAASQVASSSQTLAQGASEQAASLEETSSSTEEISSMTAKNRDNSNRAAQLMKEAGKHIETGNARVQEMVLSMREISASSESILRINKTIDDIAFQTNILALNAAVEAARAGEAGMGFAVVADEVRNLAQRCAQASKDATSLIDASIANSRAGGEKLNRVTESISAITSAAQEAGILVEEVSVGSQEQSRGLDQIAQSMSQMEAVVQRTAASAEEGASASEELTSQAESMRGVVMTLGELVGATA